MTFQEKFLKNIEEYGYLRIDGDELDSLIDLFSEDTDYNFLIKKIETPLEHEEKWRVLFLIRDLVKKSKIIKNIEKLTGVLESLIEKDIEKDSAMNCLISVFNDKKEVEELFNKYKNDLDSDTIKNFVIKFIALDDKEYFLDSFFLYLNSGKNIYFLFSHGKDIFEYFSKIKDKKLVLSFYEKLSENPGGYAIINLLKGDEKDILVFIKKAEEIHDSNLDDLLKKILIGIIENIRSHNYYNSYVHPEKSALVIQLFIYLKGKCTIVTSVLDHFKDKNIFWDWDLIDLFGKNIKRKEVVGIKEIIGNDRYTDVFIYEFIEKSEREDKEEILGEFERVIGDKINRRKVELAKAKQEQEEYLKKENEEKRQEIETLFKDLPEDNISPKLIYMFLDNKADFKDEERETIKKWVERFFSWDLLNPEKNSLIGLPEEDGTYKVEWHIADNTFSNCLNLAIKEFSIDISSIRDKIIRFIPFAYSEDLKLIFEAIANLTQEDIDVLLKSYSIGRKDNLRYHQTYNFLETYDKYEKNFQDRKKETCELLKSFLIDPKIRLGYGVKEKSLHILKNFEGVNKAYFQDLFEANIDTSINYFKDFLKSGKELTQEEKDKFELAVLVNEVLIEKFEEDAINWRFEQLLHGEIEEIDWDKKINTSGYARGISDSESELEFDKKFIKPLFGIEFSKYKGKIIELLEYSIKISETPTSLVYARYLRHLVFEFYSKALTQAKNEFKKREFKELKKIVIKSNNSVIKSWISRLQESIGIPSLSDDEKYILELENKIDELTIKLNKSEKLNHELQDNSNKRKDETILFVEGKTDKDLIEMAWKTLNNKDNKDKNAEIPYKIIACGGCQGVVTLLHNQILYNHNHAKYFGLLDFDYEGFSHWSKYLHNNTKICRKEEVDEKKWKIDTNPGEGLIKKHKNGPWFSFLLPVINNIENQVIYSDSLQQESVDKKYYPYGTYGEKSIMSIEHYFYEVTSEKEFQDGGEFFKTNPHPGGGKIVNFVGDKIKFVDRIKELNVDKKGLNRFGNFKKIFDLIDDCVKKYPELQENK